MGGKVISFFSHKGGVGKTTLTYNIGADLAIHKGKKVLLIDADGQMNLTANMFGLSDTVEYSDERDKQWYSTLNKYMNFNDFVSGSGTKPIYRYNNGNVPDKGYVFDLIAAYDLYFELEMRWFEKLNMRYGFDETYEYFSDIVNKINRLKEEYDFVLIDCSPSATSVLNAFLVLISDFFVSPVRSDFFSYQAIGRLLNIVTNWQNLFGPVQGYRTGINMVPKFLGLIVNGTKKTDASGGISKASQMWAKAVNSCLNQKFTYSGYCISVADFKKYFSGSQSNPYIISAQTVECAKNVKSVADKLGLPLVLMTARHYSALGGVGKNNYRTNLNRFCEAVRYVADCFTKL